MYRKTFRRRGVKITLCQPSLRSSAFVLIDNRGRKGMTILDFFPQKTRVSKSYIEFLSPDGTLKRFRLPS